MREPQQNAFVELQRPAAGRTGGASSQLAFDDAEDAALLTGDEDAAAAGVLRVMPAVALVDIAALDLAAGRFLGSMMARRVTIYSVSGRGRNTALALLLAPVLTGAHERQGKATSMS
jgi:hypothetical protein